MAHLDSGDNPKPVIKTPDELFEYFQGAYRAIVGTLTALDEKAQRLEDPDLIGADLVSLRQNLTTLFISVTLLHNSRK